MSAASRVAIGTLSAVLAISIGLQLMTRSRLAEAEHHTRRATASWRRVCLEVALALENGQAVPEGPLGRCTPRDEAEHVARLVTRGDLAALAAIVFDTMEASTLPETDETFINLSDPRSEEREHE